MIGQCLAPGVAWDTTRANFYSPFSERCAAGYSTATFALGGQRTGRLEGSSLLVRLAIRQKAFQHFGQHIEVKRFAEIVVGPYVEGTLTVGGPTQGGDGYNRYVGCLGIGF